MAAHAERADVLLVGNPNSGKSLLFSRLTGIAQKVANYPGVTTEVRSGHAGGLVIHDFPGIYSLEPLTLDERVGIERLEKALADATTKAIVCVLDATRLERSLYLLLELLPRSRAAHVPVREVWPRGLVPSMPQWWTMMTAHSNAVRIASAALT